jgi:Flp pilus assembly protein TadG
MGSVRSWIEKLTSSDHRKAPRTESPLLVAYYWDGSVPMSHEIRNISATGFYLLTRERWHPGTVVTMTLQRTAAAKESLDAEHYISVMSKVVRLGEDGVGFAFVPLEAKGSDSAKAARNKPADKRGLSRFLDHLKSDQGHAVIGYTAEDLKIPVLGQDANLAMPRGSVMKRLNDESGQALIISALCMTCLFGFIALAVDAGIMLREKRLLQIAADSAAIAGALELNYYPAGVTAAAKAASATNGFTDGVNGATVTVHTPPTYGPHQVAGYVEVIVSQSQPTFFMKFFGLTSMTPTVRAVAQNGGSSYGCVYILAPTGSATMELQGSFNVSTPNCGVIVDSSDPDALDFTGGGGTLTAGSVGVVGGCGGHCDDSSPAPVTGIVPQSDPLASMAAPDPTKLTCSAAPGNKLTGTLANPTGGIACYSGNVTLSNVTLGAGTYVFTGNVTLDGTVSTVQPPAPVAPATVSANPLNGTTIDLDSGTLSINTGTVLSLYAPQAAATAYTNYNGIALMEPAKNSNQITIQKGDASGLVDGIIYAPSAQLYLQDSGGDKSGGLTLITDLIVGSLFDKTATLSITSYSQSTSGSPITKVALVE